MPAAPDDWRPTATLETLRLRAALLARLRAWFSARGILEVQTPALSAAATTDPNLHSMRVDFGSDSAYLHTSPEFAMKRLLAAGSGDIYQLCRVFRDGEAGRLHGPEFTMLEWYRTGMSVERLMDEVVSLVAALAVGHRHLRTVSRLTYREAFVRHAGIDPHSANRDALVAALAAAGVPVPRDPGVDDRGLRDLLLASVVEPRLEPDRPTFIYDFPPDQAALARIREGAPPVASRFELFLGGMELANGFDELTDAAELQQRFATDLLERRRLGLPAMPSDQRLLAAQEAGLPSCSGVALGFDRIVMWIAGLTRFAEVVSFDTQHA